MSVPVITSTIVLKLTDLLSRTSVPMEVGYTNHVLYSWLTRPLVDIYIDTQYLHAAEPNVKLYSEFRSCGPRVHLPSRSKVEDAAKLSCIFRYCHGSSQHLTNTG